MSFTFLYHQEQIITNTTLSINTSSLPFYPYIAVLVEFRTVDHIIAIVHNVNHHIPSTWPIQIFHGKDNEDFIKNSTLAPLIASGKIFLTFMDQVYDRARTNQLLTNPIFWQCVRGEKILFFQIDSVMCSNSPHKITDFLQYDYIGAPWDLSFFSFNKQYRVGNGGFSLRSRSKILALLALISYDSRIPEDVWYAQNLHRVNGSIPSIEIAKTFSVESMYYARPLGVHRFPWNCRFRADLANTCPESMLIMSDFRINNRIITIVQNVNDHIPSTWSIQIFHGKDNEDLIKNSTLAPLIASGKILLTLMDQVYDYARTNELFTDPKFWQRVRGEKVLLFQIDSIMCSNSPHKITDFFQYDFIGAPWDPSWFGPSEHLVGNGGFSLRSRSKILALLSVSPWDKETQEDVWYSLNLHRVNGLIAPVNIAKTFSVETVYYESPLAVHRLPNI
ncbi:unnamed protein product [Rotaria sordida]|uniref:DUF5672 domain-containing protein n=1 Tax=Rotaria sordida TaxID=392033 RepID=A0A818UHK2_9BILA|nr:unnamed protein product [Rotaria sordida]